MIVFEAVAEVTDVDTGERWVYQDAWATLSDTPELEARRRARALFESMLARQIADAGLIGGRTLRISTIAITPERRQPTWEEMRWIGRTRASFDRVAGLPGQAGGSAVLVPWPEVSAP